MRRLLFIFLAVLMPISSSLLAVKIHFGIGGGGYYVGGHTGRHYSYGYPGRYYGRHYRYGHRPNYYYYNRHYPYYGRHHRYPYRSQHYRPYMRSRYQCDRYGNCRRVQFYYRGY